ncbi:hypothetical protein TEA_005081 [Camellia sinensis var. sinensis]|uniref:RING-type E3 ubiquitin transferase n=1 Tax=Camellia sinensis var. sinensis TaxID=542762 RepID=A0A4S4DYK8_CAMSN|nr:hypothetical protein TEA_005081 [Camellia sinensis var. sinensis]
METSTLFLFFFFSSLTIFTYKASSVDICEPTSCAASEPVIRFPFRLKTGQPDSCGYPGFDLSCNNQTQTVLTLPHSGEFTVTHIDYLQQWISINDPNFCLPNRVQNLSLSHSPFKPAFLKNYTFLNCSAHNWSDYTMHRFEPVFCLSKNPNYTVMVVDTDSFSGQDVPAACLNMSSVSAPVAEFAAVYRDSVNPSGDLLLTWTSPMCWPCEAAGGSCGLLSDSGVEIGCSSPPVVVAAQPRRRSPLLPPPPLSFLLLFSFSTSERPPPVPSFLLLLLLLPLPPSSSSSPSLLPPVGRTGGGHNHWGRRRRRRRRRRGDDRTAGELDDLRRRVFGESGPPPLPFLSLFFPFPPLWFCEEGKKKKNEKISKTTSFWGAAGTAAEKSGRESGLNDHIR